jgi:hypothetical protein
LGLQKGFCEPGTKSSVFHPDGFSSASSAFRSVL